MLEAKDLRGYKIFRDLADDELQKLAPLAREETFEPGSRIITESAPATDLYLVVKGKLQVKMTGASGEEVELDEAGHGMSVGWSTLSESRTSTASVDAVEPSTLIAFEGEGLRRLFGEDNRIGYAVMKSVNTIVSRRLDRCRTRFAARH